MHKITSEMAIRIARQFINSGKIDDAQHVLTYWQDLMLDGDIIVTEDESGKGYMPMGMDNVKPRVATSLSAKGMNEFISEYNKVVRPDQQIAKMLPEFKYHIEQRLDVLESDPCFNYEVTDTLTGNPYVINLIGEECFNWLDVE